MLRIISSLFLLSWCTGCVYSVSESDCQPRTIDFTSLEVLGSDFVAVTSEHTYALTGDGLELYLLRPEQPVKTSNGINDVLGEGATVNSTFNFLYALDILGEWNRLIP